MTNLLDGLPMHSPKFQRMYMQQAHFIASQNTACPSRQVACVIVDANNKVKGTGYNGPPAGNPHCHEMDYLTNIVVPRLTEDQQESLRLTFGSIEDGLKQCELCRQCPRKFLGYKSGEALDLCSCQHAESNALINAACDLSGCAAYMTVAPCKDCAGKLINARIVEIHYPIGSVYSSETEYLLQHAKHKILVVQHSIHSAHDRGTSS